MGTTAGQVVVRTRDYRVPKGHVDREPRIAPPWPELQLGASGRAALGDYDVLGLLAVGGMGRVYHAEERVTGAQRAIKVLDPNLAGQEAVVKRFFREHEVSRSIDHRGVIRVDRGGCTASGMPYLVMELLDGENLGVVGSLGRLEVSTIIAMGHQIADAMAAVHASGVVHCDLKPQNVVAQYRPGDAGGVSIKVIDFGAARFVGDRVVAGTVCGTPEYMAPEQWSGIAHPGSDVYALGCLLYDLIGGEVPFTGTAGDLQTAHREQTPRPLSTRRHNLSPGLEQLVLDMLAKDVGARPPMASVYHALEALEIAAPSDRHRSRAAGSNVTAAIGVESLSSGGSAGSTAHR